jgi:sugar lactone lactonase YvrE
LADVRADVGEGPLWNAVSGTLSWVDIRRGSVHLCTQEGEQKATYAIGQMVGAALPAQEGGFLLAAENGFLLLSDDGALTQLLPLFDKRPDLRFNDAKCDPAGRAFAGSVALDKKPGAGALYRLDAGPEAIRLLDGLTVANGLGWSPDSCTLWFADSANPAITGFEYHLVQGMPGAPKALIPLLETAGVADGLCVDDEGCIWVALWGGGAVHRYTPDGRLDTVVEVPAPNVTSCAFGGESQDRLFITTARSGLSDDDLNRSPQAGGLFVAHPGITGPAVTLWCPP